MPALIGLLGAVIVLAVVGLMRAVSEYGHAGLIGWGKLMLSPMAILVVAVVLNPYRSKGNILRSMFPSDRALRILLIVVGIVTGVAAISSATFGIGWIVTK
jgi:hypothetical protein